MASKKGEKMCMPVAAKPSGGDRKVVAEEKRDNKREEGEGKVQEEKRKDRKQGPHDQPNMAVNN